MDNYQTKPIQLVKLKEMLLSVQDQFNLVDEVAEAVQTVAEAG